MDIPNEFLCPITLEVMEDPVICEDGHTYEKKFIESLKNGISPITKQPINLKRLIPNRALKELIADFQKKQKEQLVEFTKTNLINTINLNIGEIFGKIKTIFNSPNPYFKNYIEQYVENYNKFNYALYFDDLNTLSELIKLNQIHKSFYCLAIHSKSPNEIEWLKEYKCHIPIESMNFAVIYANTDLVDWLLSNGCTWDILTLSFAIETKNIDFLNWLLIKGCFWGILLPEHLTIINSNPQISRWLESKKCPWI